MDKEPKNLMDGLLEEMNRVREIIIEYKSLPKWAGMLSAKLMELNIQKAEKSISNNDVVEMLVQYKELKTWEL